MGEQAKMNAEAGGQGESPARKSVSKVAAWIEEARFNRSLVGPGAHRTAYRRLVGACDLSENEPRPRAPKVKPVVETEAPREEAAAPAEASEASASPELVQRVRRTPPRRLAPRHRRRPRQQRARTTLYAVSALAAALVSAPLGYWTYGSMFDGGISPAAEQYLAEAKSPDAQVKAPAPGLAQQDVAAAKAAVAEVQTASAEDRRESLAVTEVAKEQSRAPYRSLAEAVALRMPEPERKAETASEALAVAEPSPAPEKPQKKLLDRIPVEEQPEAPPAPEQQASERPSPDRQASELPPPERSASDEPAPKPADADPRAAALLEQGEELVEQGEIASARRFFERAAELGEPRALVQLARTYDPVVLKELKVVGLKAEPEKAVELYERARAAMSGEAEGKRPGPSAWLTR